MAEDRGAAATTPTVYQAAARAGDEVLRASDPLPGVGRLLGVPAPGQAEHLRRYGHRPRGNPGLIGEIERSGLRGRGGAGFPTAVKLASVAGRLPIVVANATEGEPLSVKDKSLLVHAPHLVIDGAALVAEAVGADQVIVCLERAAARPREVLAASLSQRHDLGKVKWTVMGTPSRFVVGEETALIHWLNGGEAKPTLVPPRPFERGVAGRPTLVHNVETLAHVALVARFGARWFRRLGPSGDPGTRLLSVGGAVDAPGVYEAASGTTILDALDAAGRAPGPPPAVLVGGYFGVWLRPDQVATSALDADSLAPLGAAPGCGVVWALPRPGCGLAESARVARWYAGQSAEQCGPCTFGLPAMAAALSTLAQGNDYARAFTNLRRWIATIPGRGACRHPDGAARFIASAVEVFAREIEIHAQSGPCEASRRPALLPVPHGGGWR